MSDAFDTTLADRIAARSPVAYYKLDEASGTTAADSSGNGNDGAYSGGVTLDQPPLAWSEAVSQAVALDGTDGQVRVPVATALSGASGFAVSCEIKFPDPLVAGWPMELESEAGVNGACLRLVSASGDLRGYVKVSSAHDTPAITSPTGTIRPGATHHIVLTRDNASSTTSLFVDGVLVASNDDGYTGNNSFTGDDDMVFGSRVSGTDPIEITVDDIAVFDAALTSADAHALAARVVQETYADTVLAISSSLYYQFNDGAGTSVADDSGNSLDGTIEGGATLGQPPLISGDGAESVQFDGTGGQRIDTPFTPDTDLPWTAVMSCDLTSAQASDPASVFCCRVDGAGQGGVELRIEAGQLALRRDNSGVVAPLGEESLSRVGMLVVTYDPSVQTTKAYFDGVETGSLSAGLQGSASPLEIGNSSASSHTEAMVGILGHFAWIPQHLTHAQVEALHYRATTAAEALALAGTAFAAGVPVARLIRAHRQSDGSVIGETTSSAPLAVEEPCYVVAHGEDDEADLVIGDIYEPPPQPELVGVETAALENGNNLTIPLPADVQDGDLLVLAVAVSNSYRSISSAPAGFTVDSETPAGSGQSGAMFVLSKVASGETGPYTLTLDSSEWQAGALLAFRNVTQPATEGALAESYVAPSVAAASAGLLLGVYMNETTGSAQTVVSAPEGMTERAAEKSNYVKLHVLSETITEAGETGSRAATGAHSSRMSRLMFYPLAEP